MSPHLSDSDNNVSVPFHEQLHIVISLWRYQYRCHHSQRTKCRRNHITHNISIIVLAGPDKSAFSLHDTSYDIIDQAVEIFNACCLEFLLKLILINSCKDFLKTSVINLGDRILAAKPQVLFCIQCIIKTALLTKLVIESSRLCIP